jgi:hypothetical protein
MTDMRTLLQKNYRTGKHMHGTILLHIASIFENNASPIGTKGGTRPDIAILSNDHIAGYGRKRMHKGGFVYHGFESLELIDHMDSFLFKSRRFFQEKRIEIRGQESGAGNKESGFNRRELLTYKTVAIHDSRHSFVT